MLADVKEIVNQKDIQLFYEKQINMKIIKWIFGVVGTLVFIFFALLWTYKNFDISWVNWLFEKLKIFRK